MKATRNIYIVKQKCVFLEHYCQCSR